MKTLQSVLNTFAHCISVQWRWGVLIFRKLDSENFFKYKNFYLEKFFLDVDDSFCKTLRPVQRTKLQSFIQIGLIV